MGRGWAIRCTPLLTDVPVGAFTLVVILDVLDYPGRGRRGPRLRDPGDARRGAGRALRTTPTRTAWPRRRATVHSTLMIVALVVYVISALIRWGNPADRTVAIADSIVAYLIIAAGAYVGGDVVYALGNMVDRHAFRSRGTKWGPLEAPADIPEGVPTKAKAGAQTLVLVRRGETVFALHETCAHAGGPLSEGTRRQRLHRMPVARLALPARDGQPEARSLGLRPAGLRGPPDRHRLGGAPVA